MINKYARIILCVFLCLLVSLVETRTIRASSDDELESIQRIQERMEEIHNRYQMDAQDDILFINRQISSSMKEMIGFANELLESKEIVSYEVYEKSVVLKHSSGLTFVFTPRIGGTCGDEETETTINIITFQPAYAEMEAHEDDVIPLPDGIANDALCPIRASEKLENDFENVNYYYSTKNKNISLEDIEKLGPNQIIVFQGHGSWLGDDIHSTIITGRDFDEEAFISDPLYHQWCVEGMVVADGFNECITPKFIEKYCGNLENSLIYLGICQGAYHCDKPEGDRTLVDAFLNKGAAAVIAYSETTLIRYSDVMIYDVIKKLGDINPDTGDYYTLSESFTKAKATYGEKDNEKYESELEGSRPLLFFNPSVTDYSIKGLQREVPCVVKDLEYNGKEQTGVMDGVGFTLSGDITATNAGEYSATAEVKPGYKWSDGTTAPKNLTWSIKKANKTAEDLIPKMVYDDTDSLFLGYNGEMQDLLTVTNPSLGTYHFSLDGGEWSEDIPKAKEIGEYRIDWYFDGGSNVNNVGSLDSPITYYSMISKAERKDIIITMSDYYYGDKLPEPKIDPVIRDDAKVTYYYNGISDSPPDIEWVDMTSKSLEPGKYIIYAVIEESDHYQEYQTLAEVFTVFPPKEKPVPYIVPDTSTH